jgi:hypothetical protein
VTSVEWGIPVRDSAHDSTRIGVADHGEEPEPVYANDVQIMAEPGGLQLTFLRPRQTGNEPGQRSWADNADSEVIARVVLPRLAARRLLRLLPKRLDLQQALADEYSRGKGRKGSVSARRDDSLGRVQT